MKKIRLKVAVRDSRGEITDLLEHAKIQAVTLVTFKKGALRGNHYHKKTFQWNYLISGKIRLRSQRPGGKPKDILMNPGDLVLIGPHEKHALEGLKDSRLMVFTKGPRGGKEYESDTFRLAKPLIAAPKNR